MRFKVYLWTSSKARRYHSSNWTVASEPHWYSLQPEEVSRNWDLVVPAWLDCCCFYCFRELIRCLKWYMDRSAEVVRQDHIQEAMRVRNLLVLLILSRDADVTFRPYKHNVDPLASTPHHRGSEMCGLNFRLKWGWEHCIGTLWRRHSAEKRQNFRLWLNRLVHS